MTALIRVKVNLEKKLCRIVGHTWRYKEYTHWIKETGEKYEFKASRYCLRCKQSEYFYENWIVENKNSFYDVASDSESTRKAPIFIPK